MGAMPWEVMGPADDDPNESLRAAQRQQLLRMDLPKLVRQHLESARDAVRMTEAEGDRFNLLEIHRAELAMLERVTAQGIPTDPDQQLDLVRRIYYSEGVGNILDVIGISNESRFFHARLLNEKELRALFDTTTPDADLAATAMGKLAPSIDRGESVCFRVFDRDGRPMGWWFAGYSVD